MAVDGVTSCWGVWGASDCGSTGWPLMISDIILSRKAWEERVGKVRHLETIHRTKRRNNEQFGVLLVTVSSIRNSQLSLILLPVWSAVHTVQRP